MPVSAETVSEEPEELVRFRQQWLEEVRSKKKAPATQDSSVPAATSSAAPNSPDAPAQPRSPPAHHPTHRRLSHGAPSSPSAARRQSISVAPPPLGPSLQRAVEVYKKAVQHEQRGNLDEALQLYRTAFRMDNHVDRAYHMVEEQLKGASIANAPAPSKSHHRKTSSAAGTVDALVDGLQSMDIGASHVPVARTRGEGLVTGTLASLLSSWPADALSFEPDNEQEGVPIRRLPDELLVIVLRLLDHTSIERFARVNRKARVIALDASIWRPMVQQVLKPPQIPTEEDLDAIVLRYMTDYRRIYIEHPRVRYDGVYIAVCHYIRNGLGESAWVNYSHLITYYRYLRFLPDGQVLSLLANEELAPQQVIPLLKPNLHMKGFFIGTWYLEGTEVHIEDLLEPASADKRYSFQMILDLRSRPLGRWNRLDFREYDSVHIGSGEATPLGLKNERPFWFSKVRSYA
ncbi:hypothetical protein C8Q77DRAFT_212597 [Trametes polyzona]|nr:hypothetical protein C8Q77DRAFT_212597 [Trametes polyzona]